MTAQRLARMPARPQEDNHPGSGLFQDTVPYCFCASAHTFVFLCFAHGIIKRRVSTGAQRPKNRFSAGQLKSA